MFGYRSHDSETIDNVARIWIHRNPSITHCQSLPIPAYRTYNTNHREITDVRHTDPGRKTSNVTRH